MLGRLYQWFWFHTEFWFTRENRRPYTFIMRDFLLAKNTRLQSWIVCILWFAGSIYWSTIQHLAMILPILSAFILAHVIWGTPWIEHQQEFPEYNPDKEENE